jgi:hypothetical protein
MSLFQVKGCELMADEKVKACINLHAVLRNLEDLCELDPMSREIIQGKNVALKFSMAGIPKSVITFAEGKCTAVKDDGPCSINLFFSSPQNFNLMIEGKKNPIPTRGFRHIGFLKNEFTKLADRLSYYLKPTAELLGDKEYARINTILTAYTAFFAIPEIANWDPLGQLNASRIADGAINVEVVDGPAICITAKGGRLETSKGKIANARAFMVFDSIDTASGILNGTLDSYSCIGEGRLSISGFVPMIDNLNKILAQVPGYLM